MNPSITINRSQLQNIFATLSLDDIAWAIKELTDRFLAATPHEDNTNCDARLCVKTWTDAGVSQTTAKQIVSSLRNHKKGDVSFSGTAAEAIDFLEAL